MSTLTATPTATPAMTSTSSSATASCTTAVPGKFGNVPEDACNSNYNFEPTYAPAVAVAVLFGILTAIHIAEGVIFKRRYTFVVSMGALWETLAFVFGALGAHDQQNTGYATAHVLLFLLAPLWINAFAYMSLGRMAWYYLPEKRVWRVKATSMSKLFVWADISSFIVQAIGGVMTVPGSSASTLNTGKNIYITGIALQEFFILCFIALLVVFHRRVAQLEAEGLLVVGKDNYDSVASTSTQSSTKVKRPWRGLVYSSYAVLACITLRIAYRLAEFAPGIDPATNPLPFHEWYSYVLDAAPMMLALLILAVWHPARSLRGPDAQLPTRKERKAAKRAAKEEKRRLAAGEVSGDSS